MTRNYRNIIPSGAVLDSSRPTAPLTMNTSPPRPRSSPAPPNHISTAALGARRVLRPSRRMGPQAPSIQSDSTWRWHEADTESNEECVHQQSKHSSSVSVPPSQSNSFHTCFNRSTGISMVFDRYRSNHALTRYTQVSAACKMLRKRARGRGEGGEARRERGVGGG